MTVKQLRLSLFIFVFGILFCIPYNTSALENKVVSCDYQFMNENGKQIELEYQISSDGSVELPFSNGTLYSEDGRSWYHSDQFKSTYYGIAKINSTTITCPSIYVQENELGVTVYSNPNYSESCSGRCYNITSATPRLTNFAEDTGIKSKKVLSTCVGYPMGFLNRQSYVFPYFRLFDDGTKEWSIDGKSYVPVTNAITGTVGDEKFSVTVNDSLLNSVFSSTKASCPSQIYRCVNQSDGGYSYELSGDGNSCSNSELSASDGQQNGSNYFDAALGAPSIIDLITGNYGSLAEEVLENIEKEKNASNDSVSIDDLQDSLSSDGTEVNQCNSLLGSTEDEDSVAWLLQQLLNYIKILGPILVAILSSLDFAKSIIASDDEGMQKAQKKLLIRLILAVALFLIPMLVMALLNIFNITTDGICGLQ